MAESRSRNVRNPKTPSRVNPDVRSFSLKSDPRVSQDRPPKWGDSKRPFSQTQQIPKDPPTDETLLRMMSDLDVAIENKSDSVLKIVETILEQIKEKGLKSVAGLDMIPSVQLVLLLRWKNNSVVATVAHIFAEVAKTDEGRERLTNLQPPIALQLVNLLQQRAPDMIAEADGNSDMKDSIAVVSQVCRALGNMCYEYKRGQKCVLDAGGLPVLTTVLEKALDLAEGTQKKINRQCLLTLRTVATGFLLNLISSSEKTTCVSQLLPLLTRLLELDGTNKEGEELTEHALVILTFLLDGGDHTLDEHLCKVLVRILSVTTSIDVSGTIIDLLHRYADTDRGIWQHCYQALQGGWLFCLDGSETTGTNQIIVRKLRHVQTQDKAKLHLARAGLCKLLVQMLEDQTLSSGDEDGEQTIKMACELIVLNLNGDESMPLLYNKGQGSLYQSMKQWLNSDDQNKMVTAVLAMGNFARSDSHTLKMVEDNVGETLLELIEKHNTPSNNEIRLQHALLSAVRNLAIPETNKAYFIEKGAMKAILPLLPSPELPVMFKLLGTIRTLVDGQAEAAKELGTSVSVVRRIVECCANEYHVGVKGEANRLVAWLVKNSRSEAVCRTMLDCGAVPHLVNMLGNEHAVMRNEAILALTTICATHMPRAETLLVEAKVASQIVKMVNEHGESTPKPIIENVMTFLGELVTSELLCKKLACAGVTEALNKLLEQRQELQDLKPVVSKLSGVLERS